MQGLLTGKGRTITPRQQLEALVQPRQKSHHTQPTYPHRSQFERQRKTIQMTADLGYVFTRNDFGFSDPNDSPPDSLMAVKITSLPQPGLLALAAH